MYIHSSLEVQLSFPPSCKPAHLSDVEEIQHDSKLLFRQQNVRLLKACYVYCSWNRNFTLRRKK